MTTASTPDVSLDDLAKKLGMHLPAHDPAASRVQVALSEAGTEAVEPAGTEEDDDEDDDIGDDKRNPEKNRMRVSFATSGIAKAGLVWGGSLLGVVAVVTFYSGVVGKVGHRPPKAEVQQAEEEKTPEDERVAALQQSESQAKAELAMQRQQQQLVELNSQDPKDQAATATRTPATPGTAPATPAANRTASTARPATAPRPAPVARPVRASRVVDRSPPPRAVPAVVRSASLPVTRPAPLPTAARASVRSSAPPVDPQQEWQRLAGLGSYGSVVPSPIALASSRSALTPRTATTRPTPRSATASLPSRSAARPISPPTATPAVERSTAPPLAQYVRSQSTTPAVSEEQSRLRSLPQATSRRTVLVGSSAGAEVVSTIVWSPQTQPSSSPRFLIRLAEPLLDRDDQPILPADSLLVVSPRPLADESGLADLEVVSVVTGEAEYTPPAGAIVIRGAHGDALIARGERPGNTLGRDAAVIVSSMLSEVGGLLNRPTTQTLTSISTGGGTSTTRSSTTPPPNYLGAALEAGFGTLSDILDERNQAAISEVMTALEVFQIPGGTEVQVFVNRTLTF